MPCATEEETLQPASVFRIILEILMLHADLSVSLMQIAPQTSSVEINIVLILALDCVGQMRTAKWQTTFPSAFVTRAILETHLWHAENHHHHVRSKLI